MNIISIIHRFSKSESGAEVTELAIVLALIVAGAVATIILIGPKVAAMYSQTNNALP